MAKPKTVVPTTTPDTFTSKNLSGMYTDETLHGKMADQGMEARATPAPTFTQAAKAAWGQESTVEGLYRYFASQKHVPDPDWKITDQNWSEITKGINAEYHPILLGVQSQGELEDKIGLIIREQKEKETLGRYGGAGIALSMGAAVLDPTGWLLSAAGAPIVGGAKATRMANIVRTGLAGAGTNAAMEAWLVGQQETRDAEDILWAAGLGGAFGNVAGYLSPHKGSAMGQLTRDAVEARDLAKVKEAGLITPAGEARLAELTDAPKAKVTTMEDIMAKLDKQAADAKDEVRSHIKAKADEFDTQIAASQADTMDGSVDSVGEWITEINATSTRPVTAVEEAWLRAKKAKADKGFLSKAPKTQEEMLARTAETADGENQAVKKAADEEAGFLAMQRTRAAEKAAADLQARDDVAEFLDTVDGMDEPLVEAKVADEEPVVAVDAKGSDGEFVGKDGRKYRIEYDPENYTVRAYDETGEVVGELDAAQRIDGKFQAAWMDVKDAHQRNGLNTEMNRIAGSKLDYDPKSNTFTGDGQAWYDGTHGKAAENVDNVDMIGQRVDDAPEVIDEATPEIPPKTAPLVEDTPVAAKATYNVGDDIVVETFDGVTVAGVVRSYNPETGKMVILDDATGKPKTVNLNEDEVTDALDWETVVDDGAGGFDPAGSVGSGMPAGTKIDSGEEAAFLHFKVPGTNFKIPLRFDYYAKFARSENDTMKKLGALLLSNAVGDKGHYARGMNASEIAHLEWNVQKGRYIVASEDAYAALVKEKGWGWWEAQKNRRAFNEEVTKAVRGNSTNQYVDPHVGNVVMTIQKIHNDILEQLKKHGVDGAEDILPDPSYMMRRFNHDKILQLRAKFDPEQLEKLIAGAMRSVRPMDEVQAARVAKMYVRTVAALPYEDMGRMMVGEAGRARLRVVAEEAGVDPDVIEDVIRLVLNKPDDIAEGSNPRLKHRTLMNENFVMRLTGKEGADYDVAVSDFFENDSSVLIDMYTRQTSGMIGMAQMGIRSDADFEKLLREARAEATEKRQDAAKTKKEIQHMKDVYNHIMGRPMSNEVYGKQERILKGLRDVNFIRLMGQVGVAQVSELAATLATAGTRAMAMHMPAYREVIKMAKLGQIDDQLGRDMVNLAGFGAEMKGQQTLGRSADDVFHDPRLSKMEGALNEGRKGIAMVSGLAPVTNIMRQLSARMFSQKMLDYANGFAKVSDAQMKRMAWMGIDESNMDAIFRDMRKYMKVDSPEKGKLEGIEWEAWEKAQPETYATFRMAIWRESRRVVQESTIGETAPWMHSQIGKILTQFRGFMLVAHAKNTLNNLHHRDMEGATVFMASMLATSLAYTAQTSINFAGDKEKLDERLAIDRIALAGFQRTGFSSLIPTLYDTGASFTGYAPAFAHGRSSGQVSSAIMGNPTIDLAVTKMGGTAKNMAQMLTTNDHQWTQKDVSNAMSMVLPNVFGVRNLINQTSAQFPKYNDMREYNEQ